MNGYPEANEHHYAYMLEGLANCVEIAAARGIAFAVRGDNFEDIVLEISNDAAAVVCDRSCLSGKTIVHQSCRQSGWHGLPSRIKNRCVGRHSEKPVT